MAEEIHLPDDINKGAGRPKGVRTWRLVMREAFWYLEHAPEQLERRLLLPKGTLEKYRKRDLQMFFVLKQLEEIGRTDLPATERAVLLDKIIDRMDGKPNQPIELSGEVTTNIVDYDRMPIDLQNKWLKEKTAKTHRKNVAIKNGGKPQWPKRKQ